MTRPGLLNGHNKLNSHTGEQKDINHLHFYYNIHSGSSFEGLKSSNKKKINYLFSLIFHFSRLKFLQIFKKIAAYKSFIYSQKIQADINVNTSGDLTSGFLKSTCQIVSNLPVRPSAIFV
ncbi:hypothetical protein BpHYR1_003320 [Brachionus plicatilis]|uniref:Uncharacterized protein n=1 Tax=Brachionus plicatilis TaxID=10195 RepID=A0A3M7T2X5_BRAPC|nr:hypothetical protein BpHYR1_003320 [Brachionus plicatilis]